MNYKYPERYMAEYIAECGESYFLENCALPRIPIYCDECKVTQYFYLKNIIHKSWEWDNAENSVEDQDFFGDAEST